MKLRVGISPCPNDTFAFHGILAGQVDLRGLELEIELADIQELNDGLRAGRYDVAKASFFAALQLSHRYAVLPVGSALGFGVGPLLLARPAPRAAHRPVLCPGKDTTATLLLRRFHPEYPHLEFVHFARILPALRDGRADLGVVIHEGRFTYRDFGLEEVADLGAEWEEQTGGPLPLGGLVARRDGDAAVWARLVAVLRDSLRLAGNHRDEALVTMRRHAQELAEPVLWAHVDRYVNEHTLDLGPAGRRALRTLEAAAGAAGMLPAERPPLTFLDDQGAPLA